MEHLASSHVTVINMLKRLKLNVLKIFQLLDVFASTDMFVDTMVDAFYPIDAHLEELIKEFFSKIMICI